MAIKFGFRPWVIFCGVFGGGVGRKGKKEKKPRGKRNWGGGKKHIVLELSDSRFSMV